MSKRPKIDVYEILVRNCGKETIFLRTCNKADAIRKYTEMRYNDALPRIKVNGVDLPIIQADQEFTDSNRRPSPVLITNEDRALLRRIV